MLTGRVGTLRGVCVSYSPVKVYMIGTVGVLRGAATLEPRASSNTHGDGSKARLADRSWQLENSCRTQVFVGFPEFPG